MQLEPLFVGLFLLVLGGFQAVRPDVVLAFQRWTNRVIMGAQFEPSLRTERIVRFVGAGISILGLVVLTQAIP